MRVVPACQLAFDAVGPPAAADLWTRLPETAQVQVMGLLAAMIAAGVLVEGRAASVAAANPAAGRVNEMAEPSAVHLRRDAYIYVRQSTLAQMTRNTESLHRQYDLPDRAKALGWAGNQIVVIDDDLGRSGSSAAGRAGSLSWSPMSAWAGPGSS